MKELFDAIVTDERPPASFDTDQIVRGGRRMRHRRRLATASGSALSVAAAAGALALVFSMVSGGGQNSTATPPSDSDTAQQVEVNHDPEPIDLEELNMAAAPENDSWPWSEDWDSVPDTELDDDITAAMGQVLPAREIIDIDSTREQEAILFSMSRDDAGDCCDINASDAHGYARLYRSSVELDNGAGLEVELELPWGRFGPPPGGELPHDVALTDDGSDHAEVSLDDDSDELCELTETSRTDPACVVLWAGDVPPVDYDYPQPDFGTPHNARLSRDDYSTVTVTWKPASADGQLDVDVSVLFQIAGAMPWALVPDTSADSAD